MRWLLAPLLFALSLSACREGREPEPAPEPALDGLADEPAEDVPPATAPRPLAAADGAMPAAGAIGFGGFGPARFGASEEQVRMAWGRELGGSGPIERGGCYYLMPQPKPMTGYRIGFMVEGDKFARIDIDAADIEAPGGGKVGMDAGRIRALYGDRIEARKHKYVEGGQYLRIREADGGNGVLLFETDASGRVTTWRIGVPPQVDYVEGCS